MSAVFGYDIRATTKHGKRERILTNEKTLDAAGAALKRLRKTMPGTRMILVERLANGDERILMASPQ